MHNAWLNISDIEPSGVGSALTSKDTEYEKLQRETVNTVSSYGHGFMDIVCRDACDGHHAGRVSGYDFFGELSEIVIILQ